SHDNRARIHHFPFDRGSRENSDVWIDIHRGQLSRQQRQHIANSTIETDQSSTRDDIVTDVQLYDLRNFYDRTDIAICQAMPCQYPHLFGMSQLGSLFDGFKRVRSFFRLTISERRVGISCGVELNEPSSDCKCCPNLLFGWVNEEADIDVDGLKAFDCIGDRLLIA